VLSTDQRAVVQEAFAGLDVVAEFEAELEQEEEGEASKAKPIARALPGWVRA